MSRSGPPTWLLLALALIITAIGIVSIWSAQLSPTGSGTHAQRQMIFLIGALLAYFVVSFIPRRFLLGAAPVWWIVATLALALVLAIGEERYGSVRWIDLGPTDWQPSEFAKLAMIVCGAAWLPALQRTFGDIPALGLITLAMLPPIALVFIEPDLGTSLAMAAITFAQIIAGPLSLRRIGPVILLALVVIPLIGYPLLEGYQRQRLVNYLNPSHDLQGSGYQVAQSRIAIGSGGVFGKGLGRGTQNRLNFIPGQHTDFIFTVIGEEGGFVGAVSLLLMYALLFGYLLFLGITAADVQASLVITGVMTLFAVQTLVNIAMTLGAAPVTGIPLPFMSYGGSSLLHSYMALGLVTAAVRGSGERDDFAPGL